MKTYEIPEVESTSVAEAALDYGLTKQQMAGLLGISEKTFYNMMKADTLDAQQSDRFIFINNILQEGRYTFGSTSNFRDWLHTEQPTLGGQAPIDMMASLNGAQEVLSAIVRIRHGIFA